MTDHTPTPRTVKTYSTSCGAELAAGGECEGCMCDYEGEEGEYVTTADYRTLERELAAAKPAWIPVRERRPEEDQLIVARFMCTQPFYDAFRYHAKADAEYIDFWMPLQEAPKT